MSARRGRKIVILLTDGDDTASSTYNESTCITQVNNKGVACFTVGTGTGVNATVLGNIAQGTGGRYYSDQTSNLSAIFVFILYQLNNMVEISFRTRIGEKSKADNTRLLKAYLNYGSAATSTYCTKYYGY